MAAQIPSSLFQADPDQFAISRISLHNATVSPAITLSVLPSSGFAVQSHTADRIEFVQDPESLPVVDAHATTDASSSSPASELPDLPPIAHALLLKVHTGEGFRLSFDLEGHVLDLMSSMSQTQTQTQTQTQAQTQTPEITTAATAAATETTTTTSEAPKAASVEVEPEEDQDHLPTTDVSLSNSTASVDIDTTNDQTETTHSIPPIVYFAEACSEQDMRDLCKEQEFQRQLAEHAVSEVRPKLHPQDQDTVAKKDRHSFSWDWSYSLKDHVEEDFSGHKGVFAFLLREPSTGSIQILSQFSFWILNHVHTTSSGMRFSQPSGSNGRHWRRASTPDKYSAVSRHSSFRMSPASHNSLPSLPDATGHTGGIYAESQAGPSSSSSSTSAFPPDSEDGPLFRATVVECENHIRDMKAATKRIIKAAQIALETRKSWVAAEEVFIKELESFKPAEPLLNNYLRPMTLCLAERSETLGLQMKNLLVEPLSRFYGNDLKAAEAHRKAFDDESKEYYTFLSRYMAMKQDNNRKKSEADAKYEKKRRHFEIKRFEYWGFLLEMRVGGSKSDEILHHLTNYSEKHCRGIMDMALHAEDLKPGLDAIAADLLESHKRAASLRKERQERKRELFESYDDGSSTLLARGTSSANVPGSTPAPSHGSDGDVFDTTLQRLESNGDQSDTGASGSSPSSSAVFSASQTANNNSTPKFSGIRDLEHQDIDAGSALGRRKEGFLFATSRPSMHNNSTVLEKPSINWHKYWCVVSEGHLHEYSHWKKGATMLHNEPINLKISTVRSCRNQDRRFCFEVITPKFRRVYQATSTEDMNSWISVISNAIQSLLNGTSSCQSLTTYANKPGAVSGSDASGLSGIGRSSMDQLANALPISIHDRKQGSGLNELGPKGETRDSDHLGTRLLQLMREAHPSNSFCAECGAKNPDWCAINLGILICIECSGIHRSLGTHISKVRSFTLDTTSYTRDLCDFIRAVGNDVSKHIWEANLVQSAAALAAIAGDQPSDKVVFRKPVVNDTREYKVSFIQKKYVERAFVDRQQYYDSTSETDLNLLATKVLFQEAIVNNIPGVIAAFAAGANLNAIREIEPEAENEAIFGDNDRPLSGTGHIAVGSDETTRSSIMSESQLQANLEGMSMASDASSRFSRSTIASSVLNIPGANSSQGQDPQDMRSSSQAEMSDLSFMVMQTSPLLLALRHGVPFSLDDQYEVYPLAEFMIQNGAASNLSVEVRFMEDEEPNPVADGRIQVNGIVPEDEDSAVSSSAQGHASLEAAASWESTQVDPEDVKDLRQRSNRRSLGQVVNMREGGGSAMEYLRAKSAARGEAMPGSPPSTQSPANGEVANDSGSPSPVPQPTSTTNQQTLSPSLRPQNPVLSVSGSLSAPNSALSSPSGSHSTNGSRYQPTSIHQDISSLFQKRRESDGGLGPALFAAGKATAEHQNNTQEKNTLQNSLSLASLPSQPSNSNESASSVHSSPGQSLQLSGSMSASSRAHKVKATLSKSLRLSAAYIKNNMMKEERDHHPMPNFLQTVTSPTTSAHPVTDNTTDKHTSSLSPPTSSSSSSSALSQAVASTLSSPAPVAGSTGVTVSTTSSATIEGPLSGPYVILHKKGSVPAPSTPASPSSKGQ